MGIFKFFSSRIPSKPRNKDLQTSGSVNVSVQKNVGMRTENASTIVQNVIAPENRKGKITITDLLQIPVAEIGANDTYLVYSSGSDEAGWHTGGQFEYDGEMYDDGTFFLWSIDRWVAVYKDNQTEEKQPTLFNPLQKIVSLISKTYSQSSYDNLPGRVKAGIPIAEVRNYELDEAGVYQEKKESQTGSQSAETNVKTLVVPYARSYTQGGEMVYEGGALTPSDYERLCKGGGGNVDDVLVNGASVLEDKVAKIDLTNYVQKEDLIGYATQSWVSANFADKIWVNSQGFLKADDVKKFASTEFVYISVTNNGSSYDFIVEDKSFATAIVRDDSTRYTLKLELGFSNLTSAREFLRDYRVSVTQTNSTVQFPDSASVVTVDFLGLHIWLEINMTQGAVDPDPTAWYGIQFTKLNNIQR